MRQKAEMRALQEQQQIKNQQLPPSLDYGEDVFEDDGDGEFEAEVARAQQLSRSISREKPLSAPGSLSAPHSMSSLPSRHASEVEVFGRVDSNADPQYAIDDIVEQSNENVESISPNIEVIERTTRGEREHEDDIDSEQPVYGEIEDDIDISTENFDNKYNSKSTSKKNSSGKSRNTVGIMGAVNHVDQGGDSSVVSEVSGAAEQIPSEVADE